MSDRPDSKPELIESLHRELAGCQAALDFLRDRQSRYPSDDSVPFQLHKDTERINQRIEIVKGKLEHLIESVTK